MKFTKMHGIGNDYVYVNCFEETVEEAEILSQKVSDRHFGIGADGLILIMPSQIGDCRMRIFNADGSEALMCGNGIRCVGKYVYDHGIVKKEKISVETKSGLRYLELAIEDGKAVSVTVDMGEPEVTSKVPEMIMVDGNTYEFVGISVGNPHAVCFMEHVEDLDLEHIGPLFEHHSRFPGGTNTEFVEIVDRSHVRMRVWERGSGETWACGTGATASVVAAALLEYIEDKAEVALRGGSLTIAWDRESNHVFMTGPATEVFHGEF